MYLSPAGVFLIIKINGLPLYDIDAGLQENIQDAAEKSGPLNFFAVFLATVWDFNTKFYSFIY